MAVSNSKLTSGGEAIQSRRKNFHHGCGLPVAGFRLRMGVKQPGGYGLTGWLHHFNPPERKGFRWMLVRPVHRLKAMVRLFELKFKRGNAEIERAWPARIKIQSQPLEKRSLHGDRPRRIGGRDTATGRHSMPADQASRDPLRTCHHTARWLH